MRTAIYIEDGVIQLVLTPDNEWEKHALGALSDKPINAAIFTGAFYDCRGGWVRQKQYYDPYFAPNKTDTERSLILRVDQGKPTEEAG